jgi:hypothetical protein
LTSVAPPVRAAVLKVNPIANYFRLTAKTPAPTAQQCAKELERSADDLAATRKLYLDKYRVRDERQKRLAADWARLRKT